MQRSSDISVMMVYIIQGLVVLMVLGTEYITHRQKRWRALPPDKLT